ncbi:MAG: histidine triad nucleotide-binding protein [Bacteroidota bacterium]|nr:histidine triad nucleotide-binding protein [Bacteroidota bacterium]
MSETIFSKIIRKEIPATIVFENDKVLAFNDINPKAPVHVLIIPKQEIARVTDLKPAEHAEMLSELFSAANKVAEELGIAKDGFRLVINCGKNAGQEVEHLHIHLLGGKPLGWSPG